MLPHESLTWTWSGSRLNDRFLEGGLYLVAAIGTLLLVQVGQDATAGSPVPSYLQASGALLQAFRDKTSLIGVLAFCLGASMFAKTLACENQRPPAGRGRSISSDGPGVAGHDPCARDSRGKLGDVVGVRGDHDRRIGSGADCYYVGVRDGVAGPPSGMEQGADELGESFVGGHHQDSLTSAISANGDLRTACACRASADFGQRHRGATHLAATA
jgi:hypothetical protein